MTSAGTALAAITQSALHSVSNEDAPASSDVMGHCCVANILWSWTTGLFDCPSAIVRRCGDAGCDTVRTVMRGLHGVFGLILHSELLTWVASSADWVGSIILHVASLDVAVFVRHAFLYKLPSAHVSPQSLSEASVPSPLPPRPPKSHLTLGPRQSNSSGSKRRSGIRDPGFEPHQFSALCCSVRVAAVCCEAHHPLAPYALRYARALCDVMADVLKRAMTRLAECESRQDSAGIRDAIQLLCNIIALLSWAVDGSRDVTVKPLHQLLLLTRASSSNVALPAIESLISLLQDTHSAHVGRDGWAGLSATVQSCVSAPGVMSTMLRALDVAQCPLLACADVIHCCCKSPDVAALVQSSDVIALCGVIGRLRRSVGHTAAVITAVARVLMLCDALTPDDRRSLLAASVACVVFSVLQHASAALALCSDDCSLSASSTLMTPQWCDDSSVGVRYPGRSALIARIAPADITASVGSLVHSLLFQWADGVDLFCTVVSPALAPLSVTSQWLHHVVQTVCVDRVVHCVASGRVDATHRGVDDVLGPLFGSARTITALSTISITVAVTHPHPGNALIRIGPVAVSCFHRGIVTGASAVPTLPAIARSPLASKHSLAHRTPRVVLAHNTVLIDGSTPLEGPTLHHSEGTSSTLHIRKQPQSLHRTLARDGTSDVAASKAEVLFRVTSYDQEHTDDVVLRSTVTAPAVAASASPPAPTHKLPPKPTRTNSGSGIGFMTSPRVRVPVKYKSKQAGAVSVALAVTGSGLHHSPSATAVHFPSITKTKSFVNRSPRASVGVGSGISGSLSRNDSSFTLRIEGSGVLSTTSTAVSAYSGAV